MLINSSNVWLNESFLLPQSSPGPCRTFRPPGCCMWLTPTSPQRKNRIYWATGSLKSGKWRRFLNWWGLSEWSRNAPVWSLRTSVRKKAISMSTRSQVTCRLWRWTRSATTVCGRMQTTCEPDENLLVTPGASLFSSFNTGFFMRKRILLFIDVSCWQ